MKGITLTVNGQTVKAGANAGVIISNKESELRISLIGCDKERSYTYFNKNVKTGDDIIITYEQINKHDVSAPSLIIDYSNPENVKQCTLDEYYRLRNELMEEGLLP